jgi:tRNA(adenine34) deaminase
MFNDEPFKILLNALKNQEEVDVPIASFLEVDGKIFPPFVNQVYKDKNHLHHAEILAINHALKTLEMVDFKSSNATLYSSLEPCCMCLAFACLTRVKKIIFFAEDDKFGGTNRIFTLNSAFTKPEILCIEKEEVKTLMNKFFKTKR